MRLSEAILLGSTMYKQHFGSLASAAGHSRCAFGAAYGACGIPLGTEEANCATLWPWLQGRRVACPVCGSIERNDSIVSEHLNDEHRWTLARIAEWVRSVEPDEPEASQPVTLNEVNQEVKA